MPNMTRTIANTTTAKQERPTTNMMVNATESPTTSAWSHVKMNRLAFFLLLQTAFYMEPAEPIFANHSHDAIPVTFIPNERWKNQRHSMLRRRPTRTSQQVAAPFETSTSTIIDRPQESVTNVLPLTNNSKDDDPWSWNTVQECVDLWELTPEETLKLHCLQTKLADIDHPKNTPYEAVRFLKEYKGDVDQAEEKFRNMIQWRQENHVDTMIESYRPPKLFDYYPAGVLEGVDYDGDPIHVERTGAADSYGLYEKYGRDEMFQHAIWLREIQSRGKWQENYKAKQGHPVKQFTVIMDMDGLNRKQHLNPSVLRVGQEVSRFVQDNYPAYTKRIIIIRSPAIFKLAFMAFKPFLDESIRERIIIAPNNEYCLEVLAKYMDLRVLPPAICPEYGRGRAVEEFEDVIWEGGKIL